MPVDEELRRVVPVVRELVRRGVLVSVDTSKPEVITAALEAGAHLINDVYGLRLPGALEAAASGRAAVCVMHMQGEPRSMQRSPSYGNVVDDVEVFLRGRLEACLEVGIEADRVLIDPGFGFGKTAEHNLQLLQGLVVEMEGLRGRWRDWWRRGGGLVMEMEGLGRRGREGSMEGLRGRGMGGEKERGGGTGRGGGPVGVAGL